MKNLFRTTASITAIGVASLALASPAFAQSNDSTVTQTGEDNEANVTQAGSDNSSTITQDGTLRPAASADGVSNRATVGQRGTGGISEVDQTGDNGAFVTQATTSQDVLSTIIQENAGGGAINVASAIQRGLGGGEGSLTGSIIEQTGNAGRARVRQEVGTVDADSVLTQSGLREFAEVFQIEGAALSGVDQSGTDLLAEVYQSGDNLSVIFQSGADNSIGVRQDGEGNFSGITQGGSDNTIGTPAYDNAALGTGDAELGVFQLGDFNESQILQTGTNGDIDVVQDGDDNLSDIEQSGNMSTIEVTQDGAEGFNTAVVTQTADTSSVTINQTRDALAPVPNFEDNFALVDQAGVDQSAIVDQTGDEQTSRIFQSGSENAADVLQTMFANTSRVEQTGSEGVADINQNGTNSVSRLVQSGADNFAQVNQTGDDQRSVIDQSSPDDGDALTVSRVIVTQEGGSGNRSNVLQSASRIAPDSPGFTSPVFLGLQGSPGARVAQNGNDNVANVDQIGFAALGFYSQLGDRNRIVGLQSGTNTIASGFQLGDDNTVRLTQAPTVGDPAGRSTIRYDQRDDRNLTVLTQDGIATAQDTLSITTRQRGNDNILRGTQSGTDDVAFVTQIGNRNFSRFTQNAGGVENEIDINQDGNDGTSRVIQTGELNFARHDDDGIFNESIIRQTGDMNFARVNQDATDNFSSVVQNGISNSATVNQNVP